VNKDLLPLFTIHAMLRQFGQGCPKFTDILGLGDERSSVLEVKLRFPKVDGSGNNIFTACSKHSRKLH
jgi:hypothetical protein